MSALFFSAMKPTPIPEARVIPPEEAKPIIESEVLRTNIAEAVVDGMDSHGPEPATLPADLESEDEIAAREERKLSQLIDDDFPFDESQLAAAYGMANQTHGVMIGAAGTGKTTVTKKFVSLIQSEVGEVDMTNYWKKGDSGADPDDEYEAPESYIPSVVLLGFTGRSTQMIKKNFPRDWHPSIMTIHRCLAFYPEFYEDFDESDENFGGGFGQMRKKMRFTPAYTTENKLPWDVIIVDEAGMLGLDLWHQLYAACKPGCRIYLIGDINQLPPVHGRSILGFAMGNWPTWELTHIHRQTGKDNSIVDNAWRIVQGKKPEPDIKKSHEIVTNQGLVNCVNDLISLPWQFQMVKLPEEVGKSSLQIKRFLEILAKKTKLYDPIRDSVITAINGTDESTYSYRLGQIPLNRELATIFNKTDERYVIEASRSERRYFAVGDKVMATRNDYEAGITNGMTGVITGIAQNGAYTGDFNRFGRMVDVAQYIADDLAESGDTDEDFTLDEIKEISDEQEEGREAAKDGKDRGPASHIVTVRFGEGEHAFEIPFSSLAEVGSLMTAYVITCHKMQGGESPLVITIVHQAMRKMMFREWLYTAVTRSSARHLLLFTDLGLNTALAKQKIKGKTLKEKIESFQQLTSTDNVFGKAAVNVRMPTSESLDGVQREIVQPKGLMVQSEGESKALTPKVEQMLKARINQELCSWCRTKHAGGPENCPSEPPNFPRTPDEIHHHHFYERVVVVERKPEPIDGGVIHAEKIQPKPETDLQKRLREATATLARLEGKAQPAGLLAAPRTAEPKLGIPQWGAYRELQRINQEREVPRLTYQPQPIESQVYKPQVKTIAAPGLAALFARKG